MSEEVEIPIDHTTEYLRLTKEKGEELGLNDNQLLAKTWVFNDAESMERQRQAEIRRFKDLRKSRPDEFERITDLIHADIPSLDNLPLERLLDMVVLQEIASEAISYSAFKSDMDDIDTINATDMLNKDEGRYKTYATVITFKRGSTAVESYNQTPE